MDDELDGAELVNALIEREGGYSNNPADKGGPTCFGITESVLPLNMDRKTRFIITSFTRIKKPFDCLEERNSQPTGVIQKTGTPGVEIILSPIIISMGIILC